MESPSVVTNQDLLPVILVRDDLLDPEQVEVVRQVQSHLKAEGRPMPFGAVVLESELVAEEDLARALLLQRKLAAPPGEPKRLGTYLVESGAVKPHKLLEVLEAQAALGPDAPKLGELLVARKLVTRPRLEKAIRAQAADREATQTGSSAAK